MKVRGARGGGIRGRAQPQGAAHLLLARHLLTLEFAQRHLIAEVVRGHFIFIISCFSQK